MAKGDGKQETINGIVFPAAWDKKGNPIGIKISAKNEEEYTVRKNDKADELYDLLRKDVRVTGYVSEDGQGRKQIAVEDYEVLDD